MRELLQNTRNKQKKETLRVAGSAGNERWRLQQYEHKQVAFARPKYAFTAGYPE